jgi:hypothetical protein
LTFGIEPKTKELKIIIRSFRDGETIAKTFYILSDDDFCGDEPMRVLDVKYLNLSLAEKLKMTALNSTEFELQMLKVLEQIVFQHKQKSE